jgi:histidinol dehydrogenase
MRNNQTGQMIDVISTSETDRLTAKLQRIRARNVALDIDLMNRVSAIVEDVRTRGDAALIDYARKFDKCQLDISELCIPENFIRETAARVEEDVLKALRETIKRVRVFHEHERENSWVIQAEEGVTLGQRVTPIERVGLYVPGGSASYPSSVIMNVVPAQIAGVDRIIVVTPPGTLAKSPAVAAALLELGITEVYALGGAQAIAALAYGTETIPQVHKITGPGNRYVTAAKKLVFGMVGIDSLAGPSEVVVIADDTARAAFVASDLLAQAEHSEDASAILITPSQELAHSVLDELAAQTCRLPRATIIETALTNFGAIIVTADIGEASVIADELAPEHLEIMARDHEAIAARIRNAGAIFLGEYTPEAVGDYLAGPNHVLPTSGAARFSSGLSVRDFVKRTNTIRFSRAELDKTAPMIAALAHSEGLDGHAQSALIRMERD